MEYIVFILKNAIFRGTPLLFGAVGETMTEKSGNLNLGIPGIMAMGAISGYLGAFLYSSAVTRINDFLAILISTVFCMIGSALTSLIYCFLTVTLRANQNVTGLALTTFGVGLSNFLGGNSQPLPKITKAFKNFLPFYKKLDWFGDLFLSHSFFVYFAVAVAIVCAILLKRTKVGLHLRAVGENPATADAAGINVTKYKYIFTCVGGVIAGFGGLYYLMVISDAIWDKNLLGDIGWLAIALVIFTIWKPAYAIPASYLFGGLMALGSALTIPTRYIPLIDMLPYLVTIIVLIITSIRNKRENQPPASLGTNYFREER